MSAGMELITENKISSVACPDILAPAGDEDCFLAALAAGADAIYLGLKLFSARMEARNFTPDQLARLTELAHSQQRKVLVAFNTMLKENELETAYAMTRMLARDIGVDGLIIQDLAMIDIIRQAAFTGKTTFSTLANVSSPEALRIARDMGADRVVLPRELSLDEMRLMGRECPPELELECFVHGALCYCVSGRCYWSSYMGGKSGLRGRCVQPCRRQYSKQAARPSRQGPATKKIGGERYFSCQDLELGELTRLLLQIPNLKAWKIEGRKKGPHYVFHTVTAYRLFRDYPDNPQKRKMASEILELALGRPGVKGRFLPQKRLTPMTPGAQTASGRLAGHISVSPDRHCQLKPHFQLLPKDYLRIGTQDEHWHGLHPVNRQVPKNGTLTLKIPAHKTPRAGTPVFLVDRREPPLINAISSLKKELEKYPSKKIDPIPQKLALPSPASFQPMPDIYVSTPGVKGQIPAPCLGKNLLEAVWLTPRSVKSSGSRLAKTAFWLPPVLWPDNEDEFYKAVNRLEKAGAPCFVCNSPWQVALFKNREKLRLVAGPFCNVANVLAIETLKEMGFRAAIVSPELSRREFLELPAHSPLPLGMIIGGFWPVGISRFGLTGIDVNQPFSSPMGETFWARNYGGNFWLYPAWTLNLCEKRQELVKAGYEFFVWLDEKAPADMSRVSRPGLFNWQGELK